MAASEFALINKYFNALTEEDPAVLCGIGDDAAVVRIPSDMEAVLTMDSMLQGVHFPEQTAATDIGYKALATSISDLSAMGARAKWALLSLSLPEMDEDWIRQFSQGFAQLARQHQISLIGGDTNKGPLSVTIQLQGLAPAGAVLRRNGARPGQSIYITGNLGDAGVGLDIITNKRLVNEPHRSYFISRLNRPLIYADAGEKLRGIADSAIDISDGLAPDLDHILTASGVGAEIYMERLPLSEPMLASIDQACAWNYALTAGDDYQLCFTAAGHRRAVIDACEGNDIPVSCIGTITNSGGLQCRQNNGKEFTPVGNGYRHF